MKDTFFFSHDFGARNDPKLQNVLMEHGCEGLGVFWCVVEQIYEQGGLLPLSNCKSIAFALHVECSVVESVVNDYALFENDGKNFWSVSINNRLNKRAEIAQKRKNAAFNRWNKPQNDAIAQGGDANAQSCDANAKHCNAIKEKEIKEKEIKEKESKGEEKKGIKKDFDFAFCSPDFLPVLQDWLTYKRQRGETYKTQQSLEALYRKMHTLSGGNVEIAQMIVEQSQANNWAGLFDLKGDAANSQNAKLGYDERFENGRRTYGSGKATIPMNAPPRPSDRYAWNSESQNWIML